MSISEHTDFDDWLNATFALQGPFTAFIVLVEISGTQVTPLASTYVHVIGTEIDWADLTVLLAGSGREWQGAVFFAEQDGVNGPLNAVKSRLRLKELESQIDSDRLHINTGQFFDTWGRRMKIEAV
jgi:hypothetical protein